VALLEKSVGVILLENQSCMSIVPVPVRVKPLRVEYTGVFPDV
jgi:hypothetical protein